MSDAGGQLVRLARQTQDSVTLIAPFVKHAALSRVLKAIHPLIPVRLFTRWRPEDLAVGVSDLEVWELLAARDSGAVYLCHHLHAKCYVFDDVAAVGSANLTARALNWHAHSNLELQLTVPAGSEEVASLLRLLERTSVFADRPMYEEMRKLLGALHEVRSDVGSALAEPTFLEGLPGWLPHTRNPSQLFLVYAGSLEHVARAAIETATADLAQLGIPPLLTESNFNSAVRLVLSQLPFFECVDRLVETPRRFGELRALTNDYLREHGIDRDAADTWQTCLRWLRYFRGDRYELATPGYSEILSRRSGS